MGAKFLSKNKIVFKTISLLMIQVFLWTGIVEPSFADSKLRPMMRFGGKEPKEVTTNVMGREFLEEGIGPRLEEIVKEVKRPIALKELTLKEKSWYDQRLRDALDLRNLGLGILEGVSLGLKEEGFSTDFGKGIKVAILPYPRENWLYRYAFVIVKKEEIVGYGFIVYELYKNRNGIDKMDVNFGLHIFKEYRDKIVNKREIFYDVLRIVVSGNPTKYIIGKIYMSNKVLRYEYDLDSILEKYSKQTGKTQDKLLSEDIQKIAEFQKRTEEEDEAKLMAMGAWLKWGFRPEGVVKDSDKILDRFFEGDANAKERLLQALNGNIPDGVLLSRRELECIREIIGESKLVLPLMKPYEDDKERIFSSLVLSPSQERIILPLDVLEELISIIDRGQNRPKEEFGPSEEYALLFGKDGVVEEVVDITDILIKGGYNTYGNYNANISKTIKKIVNEQKRRNRKLIAKFHTYKYTEISAELHRRLELDPIDQLAPSDGDIYDTFRWRELLSDIYGQKIEPLEVIGGRVQMEGELLVRAFKINPEAYDVDNIPKAYENEFLDGGIQEYAVMDKRMAQEAGLFSEVGITYGEPSLVSGSSIQGVMSRQMIEQCIKNVNEGKEDVTRLVLHITRGLRDYRYNNEIIAEDIKFICDGLVDEDKRNQFMEVVVGSEEGTLSQSARESSRGDSVVKEQPKWEKDPDFLMQERTGRFMTTDTARILINLAIKALHAYRNIDLKSEIEDGEVLDAGFGDNASEILVLAETFNRSKIHAVDWSGDNILKAEKEKARQPEDIRSRITLYHEDVSNLSVLRDSSIKLIFADNLLLEDNFIQNPQEKIGAIIDEFCRILAEGGYIVILPMVKVDDPIIQKFRERGFEIISDAIREVAKEKAGVIAYHYFGLIVRKPAPVTGIREVLEQQKKNAGHDL